MFIDLLMEISEIWNTNIAAYCLMTNHYHVLLQTPDANISRCKRHLNSLYTQRYNKRHKFDGPLIRGRLKPFIEFMRKAKRRFRRSKEFFLTKESSFNIWAGKFCYKH